MFDTKQVPVIDLITGATEVADLTSPRTRTGRLLIYTIRTLVPSDTERMNELVFEASTG